jgi:hypothetical protein
VFRNSFAALPSFHFAWVALAGAAVWTNTASRAWRAAVAAFCALMFWAIIVTANHFFLDLILGVLTVVGAWVVTNCLYRLANRRRGAAAGIGTGSGLAREGTRRQES